LISLLASSEGSKNGCYTATGGTPPARWPKLSGGGSVVLVVHHRQLSFLNLAARLPAVHAKPAPRHPQVVGVVLAERPLPYLAAIVGLVVEPSAAGLVVVGEPCSRLIGTAGTCTASRVHSTKLHEGPVIARHRPRIVLI
jgi:hypothetical protein